MLPLASVVSREYLNWTFKNVFRNDVVAKSDSLHPEHSSNQQLIRIDVVVNQQDSLQRSRQYSIEEMALMLLLAPARLRP